MPTSPSLLPDLDTLTAGLASVFDGKGPRAGRVSVLDREANGYASNSRSEIVTCRLADGSERRLLCKYENRDRQSWSDVAYEAEVYRHVLQPAQVSAPRYYGAYREGKTGRTWLVLEYLDGGLLLDELLDADSMILAARWLGRFHAAGEARLAGTPMPFLKRFDTAFYLDYLRRAVLAVGPQQGFAWLPVLARRFEDFVRPLWAARPTVSHGDYAPNNVLFRDRVVYPLDWELAGIDLGEADLVFHIDGWPAHVQEECLRAYQQARWPEGTPADFDQAFRVARLCLYCYQVGVRAGWTTDEQLPWYSRRLRSLAEQLGLI